MDPAKKYFSSGVLEKTAIGAAGVGNNPTKAPFPSLITYVNVYGQECEIRIAPNAFPGMTCSKIATSIGNSENGLYDRESYEGIYDMKFNGVSYPSGTTLGEIHELIDLSKPTRVTVEWGDLAVAKKILEKKTVGNGTWKIEHSGNLAFFSNDFSSSKGAEEFIKNFSESMASLKIGLKSNVRTLWCDPKNGNTAYQSRIYIEKQDAKTITRAVAASDICRTAPLIAQAMRDTKGNLLGMLPLDVLCNLGPFLAPNLSKEDAFEKMLNKIEQSKDMFFSKEKFLCIKPVRAYGVRTSIGATSCLLLDKSGVSRAQAENLENIAGIDFSNRGMELKFPNKEYAERFHYGLKNSGYSSSSFLVGAKSDKFGKYEAVVRIEKLHEVKKFVEVTCGYGSSYTKGLFGTNKEITLDANFFIDELTYIGSLKNSSTARKKQMAKAVLDGFLNRLSSSEAARLQLQISELARPNNKEEPGPLQFLREHTGMKSILPGVSYSDEAGAYKAVLAKIGKLHS